MFPDTFFKLFDNLLRDVCIFILCVVVAVGAISGGIVYLFMKRDVVDVVQKERSRIVAACVKVQMECK